MIAFIIGFTLGSLLYFYIRDFGWKGLLLFVLTPVILLIALVNAVYYGICWATGLNDFR